MSSKGLLPKVFRYRASQWKPALLAVLLLLTSLYPAVQAYGNRKALKLWQGMLLSPKEASQFYWLIFGLLLLAAVVAIYFFLRARWLPKTLELRAGYALLLKPTLGLRTGSLTVPYDAIMAIERHKASLKRERVEIRLAVGRISLRSSRFESFAAYKAFLVSLNQALSAVQSGHQSVENAAPKASKNSSRT